MSIELERSYRFSAAHLYSRPEWSEAENRRRFGRCAIAPGHGHNYRLTLRVDGTIDPATGFVVDLGLLDELVERLVIDRLDHQHLNHAVEEFSLGRELPTTENLANWIRAQLVDALPDGTRLVQIRIAEDDDLAAIWSAPADDA